MHKKRFLKSLRSNGYENGINFIMKFIGQGGLLVAMTTNLPLSNPPWLIPSSVADRLSNAERDSRSEHSPRF